MKPVLFFVLLSIQGTAGGQLRRDWIDWMLKGKALAKAGCYVEAAQAFRNALASAAVASIADRELVGIHDALAEAFADAGQYAEADHEYLRGLTLVESSQGRQSLDYALITAEWAILPTRTDDNELTISLLREALARNRSNADWKDLASIQSCLGEILVHQRRLAEAEPVLLELKADLEGRKDTPPDILAHALDELGFLRFGQQRYAESAQLYRESISAMEIAKGSGHPSLLLLLNGLAAAYTRLDRLDDSDLIYKRALAVCRNTLGENHLTCAVLLQNYGVVLRKYRIQKRGEKDGGTRSRDRTGNAAAHGGRFDGPIFASLDRQGTVISSETVSRSGGILRGSNSPNGCVAETPDPLRTDTGALPGGTGLFVERWISHD